MFYWPIALIVVSNIFYHICAKQMPQGIDPFASLTVNYLVAAVASGILYFVLRQDGTLLGEYRKIDWTCCVLGLTLVGLEAGSIYMYRMGWNVNTGQLVYSVILSIALIFVGYLLYHEAITWSKVIGIVLCLIGLVFINR